MGNALYYEEGKPVLCGVDTELCAGGCYALAGGSGSGISMILNLLMASSLSSPYDHHTPLSITPITD
ncbi:MAG: hypothetical protein IJM50_04035 [Lachnospiraceae bacterium]|nr:hypothetical protein [Lachnospiraceae bacterium]